MCHGGCKAEAHFQAFDLVINSLVFSCNPEATSSSTYTTVCRIGFFTFSSACLQSMPTTGWLQLPPHHHTGLSLCCCQNGEDHARPRLKQLFPIITTSSIPLRYGREPRNDSCECWLALRMLRAFGMCLLEKVREVTTGLSPASNFGLVALCVIQCATELEGP